MKVYPAIDIIGGKVVRLLKGDYQTATNYSLSPLDAAQGFSRSGARYLHVVDLDGAKEGKACNAKLIGRIISQTDLKVEVGGGIRTEAQICDYLSAGADRVILGTIATENFAFVEECVKKYGDKIVVGVDSSNGFVCVSGWQNVTNINSFEFCVRLANIGVKNIIYTDISRDGTLAGTNLRAYRQLVKLNGVAICASGGVSSLSEIEELKGMGVDGVILGKALYEGKLSLAEALEAARGE